MSNEKLLTCVDCLHVSSKKYPVKLQPCPFRMELYGDCTPVALCDSCARDRYMEV